MNRNTLGIKSLVALAFIFAGGQVIAQTSANGPYYATPSWDQTLPAANRFVVLTNFNSEAFLDRETGLVWARTPANATVFAAASRACVGTVVGGHLGFRMPTAAELGTLIDPTNLTTAAPYGFAAGAPFSPASIRSGQLSANVIWTTSSDSDGGQVNRYVWIVEYNYVQLIEASSNTDANYAICVRSPGGLAGLAH